MRRMKPSNTEEVAEAVRAHARVVAVGHGSKPALRGGEESTVIEMAGVAGMTDYQASEYTFTARAGTPVREVQEALAQEGQYLPFDPHFVAMGATLGGTVASGISGPGRFRFGGLRDFLLGVEFVDGNGCVVRSGGRVVKNAAGFDLPKFLVGSLGSFGIMTELTFKVFPRPVHEATLRVACESVDVAVARIVTLSTGRWEAEAIEYAVGEESIYLRIGAPPVALDILCAELAGKWPGEVKRLEEAESRAWWDGVREMSWADGMEMLVKVPVTPSKMGAVEKACEGLAGGLRHYSSGGAVAWIATDRGGAGALDETLSQLGLRGLIVRSGQPGQRWLGRRWDDAITGAVKRALDPEGKFPEL